jgi:UDP-glucose 4-epimerase
MSVLVTGGNGAIGSWVLHYLLERNVKPVSYDTVQEMSILSDISEKFTFVKGDVTDLFDLISCIKKYGVDRIIHAAGMVGPKCNQNPRGAIRVNCEGTLNVLEAARLSDIKRIVYFSAKSVYGAPSGVYGPPLHKKITEDHPKNPIKMYDTTKLMAENLALNYANDHGISLVTLKFPSLYGPLRVERLGFFAIVDRLINNALAGKPIQIAGGADAKEEWCYNKDCARGAVLACLAENPRFKQYHMGTGQAHSMQEVVDAVRQVIPNTQVNFGSSADYYGVGFMYNYILDITRAREDLGYEPKYYLPEGIKDYVHTMKSFGIEPVVT